MPVNFAQNLKFAHVPEARVDDFQFNGGLVTDDHETNLDPNQSPDLANFLFNRKGSIATRNGYLRFNGNPQGISADQSNTGAIANIISITDQSKYVAQTFQPSGAISCVQVDTYMAMHNSGETQLVRAELWTTSAGAPSALLGTGQILLVSGTSETLYSFRFREPVSLSASTTYAIVLKPFIGNRAPSVNRVDVSVRGNTYANGMSYTSTDAGLTWSSGSALDLRFVVYSGGTTSCTGLMRFYTSTGISQFIAKIGTSLYRGNDSTGALTALTMGSGISFTSANFIDYTIVDDTLLVVDHDHKIQKYRGSTNSNYSTGTITVTNGSSSIVGSGTSWATSTNCEVGEYIKLPDGKWYKITVVTDNTHVTIEISYQGSTLSGQTYTISPWGEIQGKLNSSSAPTSLTVPTPKFIENHLDRIWGLDGNNLYFSTLDTSVTEQHFNDWDTSNNAGEIIIPSGKGDSGTGLYSLGSYLYVFQRNAIWEIFGSSPTNFELRNISNEIGMIDKRTLVEYNGSLYFLSDKGVYRFDGTNLENLTEGVINTAIQDWANVTSPAAVLWKNKYIIAYTPNGSSYNSEALFYDIVLEIWGKIEGTFANCWVNWNGGNDTGQIYYGSSNQGTIYLWDTGGHDDGYEIDSRYQTPSISFGARVDDKAIKKVYLQQLALGHWTMTATMTQDVDGTSQTETVDLDTGENSLWDVSIWDVDSWSPEGSLLTTRLSTFQGNAKYARFKFENNGYDEGLELLGMTATARVRRLT